MIRTLPLGVVLTLLTFFAVLGLITFRLLWIAPFAAKRRLLPKSWQRWIFDEPHDKEPN